jgi:hypothetical protein
MKYSQKEKDDVREQLLTLLPPGAVVYTRLNHVSRSGMSRSITPYVIIDNLPYGLAYYFCVLEDQSLDRYDGVNVSGCGMDMGFHLVYNISYRLYPEGFGIPMFATKECKGAGKVPKTKAEAEKLLALGYFSCGRNGDSSGWDTDGGYALSQNWL